MKNIKLIYASLGLFIVVSLLTPSLLAYKEIQPSDKEGTYSEHNKNPGETALINLWTQAGYIMPKLNETFKWSDFLSSVPEDQPAQQYDLAVYTDKDGDRVGGVVVEPITANDGSTGLSIRTFVPGGTVYLFVDDKDIIGLLRPHKDTSAKPAPTDLI